MTEIDRSKEIDKQIDGQIDKYIDRQTDGCYVMLGISMAGFGLKFHIILCLHRKLCV